METHEEKRAAQLLKRKQYREANRERLRLEALAYYYNNRDKMNEAAKQYQKDNTDKVKEQRKQYQENNVDKIKQSKKLYREANKEQIAAQKKAYREANKDKIKEYYIKRKPTATILQRERRQNDTLFKLRHNVSSLIRNSFKAASYKKNTKTEQILGCTFDQFKEHLESQFESWMNWDNRGLYNGTPNYGWDIDHIVPNSSGETLEDIIRLNHYTNLKPLCSYINRDIKRNNLDFIA